MRNFDAIEEFSVWCSEGHEVRVTCPTLCRIILALRDSGEFSQLEALVLVTLTVTQGSDPVLVQDANDLINHALSLEKGGMDMSSPPLPPQFIEEAKTLLAEVEKSVQEVITKALDALHEDDGVAGVLIGVDEAGRVYLDCLDRFDPQSVPLSRENLDQMSTLAAIAAAQVPANLRN